MQDKEMEEIFTSLNEENKNIITMISQAMLIAQSQSQNENHIPRID